MKQFVACIILVTFFLTGCNNNKKLLVKQWDCVKVENLAPVDKHFLSSEDSLLTVKMETALQNLSWTFNHDNSYQCSSAGITTARGIYSITDNGKQLVCTSEKNNINRYGISSLTETELVLQGYTTSAPIIMYFRPH